MSRIHRLRDRTSTVACSGAYLAARFQPTEDTHLTGTLNPGGR